MLTLRHLFDGQKTIGFIGDEDFITDLELSQPGRQRPFWHDIEIYLLVALTRFINQRIRTRNTLAIDIKSDAHELPGKEIAESRLDPQ